jgi:hypothetical protein
MNKELSDLIQYRIARAREALDEVRPWLKETELFVNSVIKLIEHDTKTL